MAEVKQRWLVHDREDNPIYLSEERWQHIVDGDNHPEVADFEEELKETLRKGRRRQEPLNPRKYRYALSFDHLPEEFNHIVVIVLFEFDIDVQGQAIANNYIVTAFLKHIRLKGKE